MLDVIGTVVLVGILPVVILAIVVAVPNVDNTRWLIAGTLVLWFAWTALAPPAGALPGIVLPVLLAPIVLSASATGRQLLMRASLPWLIGIHVTRLAGGLFILLHADGRLANPFASVAGCGDIVSAVLAVPAAWLAYQAAPGWEKWVIAWNIIGFVDFITAVTLGATSQVGSPIQVFMELPGATLLRDLPWRFIPGYYVPLFLIIHVAIFMKILAARPPLSAAETQS
jgi:hypothetical protein